MQLNLLIKPVAEVTIGTSPIYLYHAGIGIVSDFCEISETLAAVEKFRKLLPFVASLSVPQSFREEREPLPEELVAAMSAAELEEIAGVYAGIPTFDKVRAGSEELAPLARQADESATAYLDRLFHAEAARQRRIFAQLNAL